MTNEEIEQIREDNRHLKVELDAAWAQVRELEKKNESLRRTLGEAEVANKSTIEELTQELNFLKGKVDAYEFALTAVRYPRRIE